MVKPARTIAKQAAKRVPSPLIRWPLRIGIEVLLPVAGAAALAAVHRARWHYGGWRGPAGTVVVEVNRDLRFLAPESGEPAAPLTVLAERADITLAGVPGRAVTWLRAVPKRPGDDIRRDVDLAKQRLETATS
ncbi:hypothetical protein ABIA31_006516 [Catenulispora sp. MAP5-51]|uniref:hypothetical protein n=1 Tax=Catenulispora sp. MAP5-51 TaxID=3156298 RepID=UPI0035194814